MAEINSEESLFRCIATKGVKSTRKTRKCTAACVRTNKGGDRSTGTTDTAAGAAAAASLCCNDAVQKTYRPAQQHDRGSACIKNAADCRGQCSRTGKYAANDNPKCTRSGYTASEGQCTVAAAKYGAMDNPQCTGTRCYRANEGQCTVATAKYGAKDNPQCTSTRNSYRANEVQCTVTAAKYGATDNPQCTSARCYRANEGQCTGAAGKYAANDDPQCTDTGNYRANDGQCTGTGNYGINHSGCNGCSCISKAAAGAAACIGGANDFGSGRTDTLVSTVSKWASVVVNWTWGKRSKFLLVAVTFFITMYFTDYFLCTCEEVCEK